MPPRPRLLGPLLRFVLLSGALATAASPAPAGDAPEAAPVLSVEAIFGGPPITAPGASVGAWCPDGDAWWAAWGDAEGGRALEAVDAASGDRRVLVRGSDLEAEKPATADGREVPMRGIGRAGPRDLLFSEDGKVLFFAWRGDVHRLDLATGARARLTRTRSPISDLRAAPDGKKICFARDHDLWAVVLEEAGPREIRLTSDGSETIRNAGLDWLYPEELDASTAAWWSPDSARVAFLRLDESRVPRHSIADPDRRAREPAQFYPHPGEPIPVASVGVAGLDGAPPRWIDLPKGEIYVPWVAWHPTATDRLLVAVLARSHRRFEVRLAGLPGAEPLHLDGVPDDVVWTETDDRWVEPPGPPRFARKENLLVWHSRKDGFWRHWATPPLLPEERAVTPPGRDAGGLLALEADRGTLLYEGSTPDRTRTTVLRARLDGSSGEPEVVLSGDRNHAAAASPGGRWIVDSASLAMVAPETTLRRADGSAARSLARQRTPASDALARAHRPEFLEVPVAEGVTASAMLLAPANAADGRRHPLIVHVYGGPGSGTVRDAWRGAGGLFAALLAQQGFGVLSVDGRGTGGRGRDFEVAVHRRLGLLEAADQAAAARWVAAHRPWADPARIGIWGWSFGGTVACLALERHPEAFSAAVAVAPVTDWRLYDATYTERYMDRPEENRAGYDETSAVAAAKGAKGALLLLHGLADDNVHVENTLRLSSALLAAGRPFEQMLYPGRGHGIEGEAEHRDVHRRVLEHFRRHLSP